jgi:hypothetical protein
VEKETPIHSPTKTAETNVHLGPVLWELGRNRKRAHTLVAEAAAPFQGDGANPEEFEELTVWLKKHPAP